MDPPPSTPISAHNTKSGKVRVEKLKLSSTPNQVERGGQRVKEQRREGKRTARKANKPEQEERNFDVPKKAKQKQDST